MSQIPGCHGTKTCCVDTVGTDTDEAWGSAPDVISKSDIYGRDSLPTVESLIHINRRIFLTYFPNVCMESPTRGLG